MPDFVIPRSTADFDAIADADERERVQRDAYERVAYLMRALGTCTSGYDKPPANERPRYETSKYPRNAWVASPQVPAKGGRGVRQDIEVTHHAGRPELPIVTLKKAS